MKLLWALALLLFSCGLCLAQSEGMSLGEIARAKRAGKTQKRSAVVITNDTLASQATAAANTGHGPVAGSAAPGADPGAPDGAKGQEKSATPSGIKEANKNTQPANAPPAKSGPDQLKKELEAYKAQLQGWQGSAQNYQNKLAAEKSEFRRSMYQDALDNDRKNMALYQRKIDAAETELERQQAAQAGAQSPPR